MIMKDFPGNSNYQVTTNGDVISKDYNGTGRKKLLKQTDSGNGYVHVVLCKDNKKKTYNVHRLVAETFLENLNNLPQINHENGIKTDNRADNLEWATASENALHSYRTGLHKSTWKGKFGKEHNTSKPVHQIDKITGKIIKTWDCISDVKRVLDIHIGNIGAVCKGIRNYAGGFLWRYV